MLGSVNLSLFSTGLFLLNWHGLSPISLLYLHLGTRIGRGTCSSKRLTLIPGLQCLVRGWQFLVYLSEIHSRSDWFWLIFSLYLKLIWQNDRNIDRKLGLFLKKKKEALFYGSLIVFLCGELMIFQSTCKTEDLPVIVSCFEFCIGKKSYDKILLKINLPGVFIKCIFFSF